MTKIYREVGISVGMGEYPTNFTTAVIDVMTENDIAKLLIEFPPRYDSYRKIVDIGFITSSQVYTVETYEMTYSDELEKYFFYIGRKFTYGDRVYLQFRCLYSDGQESVDAAILKLKFRPALRINDFVSYENNDLETQSEILEKLVIQHANVDASSIFTGHVRIDNDTIVISGSGVISAVVSPPPPISIPLIIDITNLGIVNDDGTLLDQCESFVYGGTPRYEYEWYFDDETIPVITRTAVYGFPGWFEAKVGLIVTDHDDNKSFGGFFMSETGTSIIPDVEADFKVWMNILVSWGIPDTLELTLTSTVLGGVPPYTYDWYLGTDVVPVTTPDAYVEFIIAGLPDVSKVRVKLMVTDSEGTSVSEEFALTLP